MKRIDVNFMLMIAVFLTSFSGMLSLCEAQEKIVKPSQIENNAQPALQNIAFVKYDQAPKPVGGFAALHKHVVYPEIARKAGIEGRVIVNVLINESGQVDSVKILKSLGHNGCDQAAINAVKAVQWRPAQYKGKPVSVWVGMPVIFRLSGGGEKKAVQKVEVYASSDSTQTMKFNISSTPNVEFVKYDEAPEPVGGFAALQKHVVYPEIARKAGIEGRVIINVLVNKSGQVDSVTVLKSLGESGCDQAAINAVKAVQWRPAQYKGEPVSVWVGMPVIFKLDKAIENND